MDNKEVMNTINKPMSVMRDELIGGIVGAINNSGLPLYFVEPILKDLLSEVSAMAQKQIASEKAHYENAIMEQSAVLNEEINTTEENK